MTDLNNLPDDFWRKAFNGADEQPPQRVWDAVERQLDDNSKTRILPLWRTALLPGLRMLGWGAGAAASVALLIGWLYMHGNDPIKPASVAVVSTHAGSVTQTPSTIAPTSRQPTYANALAAVTSAPNRHTRQSASAPDPAINPLSLGISDRTDFTVNATRRYATSVAEPRLRAVQTAETIQPILEPVNLTLSISITSVPADQSSIQSAAEPIDQLAATALARQNAPSKATQTALTTDISPAPTPAPDTKAARPKREKWASLSVMPGAYNPSVALANTPAMVANAAYTTTANQTTPAVDSHSSRSIAYQLSAGIQLTEHWSVEGGVGYLTAQSTVDSPAQASLASVSMITVKDAQATNNLFVDAIRSRTTSQLSTYIPAADAMALNQSYTTGQYASTDRQTVSNDYQFVQVPVQVGYQLRPRKRLGLALIGGFLTNIFVRNTVASQLVVTPADDIYRSLSWAASVGARFRYRPSQHWSASVAGLYQPTLGNSTVADSPIRTRPTSAGMSFGVDYHF